jgi:hypothetical protein
MKIPGNSRMGLNGWEPIPSREPVFPAQEAPLKKGMTELGRLIEGDEQNRDAGVTEPRRNQNCAHSSRKQSIRSGDSGH